MIKRITPTMWLFDEEIGSGENEWDSTNNLTGASSYFDHSMGVTFEPEYIFDRLYVRVIFFILYFIVFCFCFLGNLAVVLAVTLHWRMRSITKFCLGNLAFANLCVGIFCIFQNLSTYLMESWVFGSFLCKMYHFINSLSHTASILILVVICVERYLAILHPFTCRSILTTTRLRLIVLGVWLISAVISAPRLYYMTTYHIPSTGMPDQMETICAPEQNLYNNRTFDMIYFILLFIFPLSVMSVLYTRVGVFLWRSCPRMESANPDQANRDLEELSVMSDSGCLNSSSEMSDSGVSPKLKLCRRISSFRTLSQRLRRCGVFGQKSSRSNSASEYTPEENIQVNVEMIILNNRYYPRTPSNGVDITSCSTLRSSSISEMKGRAFQETTLHRVKHRVVRKPTLRSILKARGRRRRFHLENKLLARYSSSKNKLSIEFNFKTNANYSSSTEVEVNSTISYPPNYPYRPKEARQFRSRGGRCEGRIVPRICTIARKKMLKSRQAAVRMLIIIVITFAICNLPFHVRKICQNYLTHYDFESPFSHLLTPVTFLLMYANCAINPVIYAFMSKHFRASFKELMKCKFGRNCFRRQESIMTV